MPGNLRGWLREIGKKDEEDCRWCSVGCEDGEHIVFQCEDSGEIVEAGGWQIVYIHSLGVKKDMPRRTCD